MHESAIRVRQAVFDFSESTKSDPHVRVYCTSEGLVSEEVRRTGIINERNTAYP